MALQSDKQEAASPAGHWLILSFGFLSAMAPLSVDIYLPALPMLQHTFGADQARTLLTLSAFLIGFGAGQLFLGPLSDRFGRKRPLIAGLILYLVASVGCALADSITAVIVWRFLQAVGGCAVPVMMLAMVRDLFDRDQGARVLSLIMLVMGMAPIAAPLIGGQVMLWFDWRAIFWVLAAFGLVCLAVAIALPETLSEQRRNRAHPVAMILGYGELFGSRRYIGYVFGVTFYYCALFAFIAGSPFVYIEHFRVSPQYYGFLFGVNIIGMMIGSFVNARIVIRRGSDRLLRGGLVFGVFGAVLLAATGISGIRRDRGRRDSVLHRAVDAQHDQRQRQFRRARPVPAPRRVGVGVVGRAAIRQRRARRRAGRLACRRHARTDVRGDGRLGRNRAAAQSGAGEKPIVAAIACDPEKRRVSLDIALRARSG